MADCFPRWVHKETGCAQLLSENEASDTVVCSSEVCLPFETGFPALFEIEACAAVICTFDAWVPRETRTVVSVQADFVMRAPTVFFLLLTVGYYLKPNIFYLLSHRLPLSELHQLDQYEGFGQTHTLVSFGAGLTILFTMTRIYLQRQVWEPRPWGS